MLMVWVQENLTEENSEGLFVGVAAVLTIVLGDAHIIII